MLLLTNELREEGTVRELIEFSEECLITAKVLNDEGWHRRSAKRLEVVVEAISLAIEREKLLGASGTK